MNQLACFFHFLGKKNSLNYRQMLATDPIAALVSTYPGSWVNLLFHWGGGFHPWSHVTLAVAFACLRSLPAHQLHLFVVCIGDPNLVHSQRKT